MSRRRPRAHPGPLAPRPLRSPWARPGALTVVYAGRIHEALGPLDWLWGCVGFDWDEGNSEKNWIKHRVSRGEAEEVFFNQPLLVADDEAHSLNESRYYALGRTNAHRLLFVVFTIRGSLIRVISARNMTRREREVYDANG